LGDDGEYSLLDPDNIDKLDEILIKREEIETEISTIFEGLFDKLLKYLNKVEGKHLYIRNLVQELIESVTGELPKMKAKRGLISSKKEEMGNKDDLKKKNDLLVDKINEALL